MEMLVVLTIIAIVAALAVPTFFRQPTGVTRARAVSDLDRQVFAASSQARQSGKIVRLDLAAAAPGSRWQPALGKDSAALFYPDGSSNGGTLSVGERELLVIGWLDGRVQGDK